MTKSTVGKRHSKSSIDKSQILLAISKLSIDEDKNQLHIVTVELDSDDEANETVVVDFECKLQCGIVSVKREFILQLFMLQWYATYCTSGHVFEVT